VRGVHCWYPMPRTTESRRVVSISWDDIRGCPDVVTDVRRAAQCDKSMLLSGPPGVLQTMIARRIPLVMRKLGTVDAAALAVLYDRYNADGSERWRKGGRPAVPSSSPQCGGRRDVGDQVSVW
jgi:predicted ATPase with chaperone activity